MIYGIRLNSYPFSSIAYWPGGAVKDATGAENAELGRRRIKGTFRFMKTTEIKSKNVERPLIFLR